MMGKKSDPPAAPDYTAAAKAQGQESLQNTAYQTAANRPNIYTPFGSQTWNSTAGVDPSTGKPITNWASQIQLAPDQQVALNDQMRIQKGLSSGAEGLLGMATSALGQPMNWGGLPDRAGNVTPGELGGMQDTAGNWRQRAQDAVTQFQAPQLAQRRESVESQLTNQGIPRGSEAWANAMRDLGDEESRAGLQAIDEGRAESDSLYNKDLTSSQFGNTTALARTQQALQAGQFNNANRASAVSENMARRSQPLNELNALLTGQQVGMPSFPGFTSATKSDTPDLLGAAKDQYQGLLDQYNADQAQSGSLQSGLFSLGSAATMYF